MKSDWDQRAKENARFYIHSTKKDQTEEEFDISGRNSVRKLVLDDLSVLTSGKNPKEIKILEIGCGIGRMTKHLAEVFGLVCGVDVSDDSDSQETNGAY